jgi:diguanylate cyclase (GGDEF)-like protein/PAS domain S-box-containing protein
MASTEQLGDPISRERANALPDGADLLMFKHGLVLANVAVLIILLATVSFALSSSYQAYVESGQQHARNLTRSLSLGLIAEIRQIDNALQTVTQELNRPDRGAAADAVTMRRIVGEQHSLLPQVEAIRVLDANGTVLNGDGNSAATLADSDFFRQARQSPGRLTISEPRAIGNPPHWGIVLARARLDPAGRFLGVAYTDISAAHLVDQFDDMSLGDRGAVSLRSDSLRLIARFTQGAVEPASSQGSSNVSHELFDALSMDLNQGVFRARSALDGIERTNAYLRIQDYPLLLIVGLPTRDAYAPWKVQVGEMLCLALLLEAVVVGLSARILKQQRYQLIAHREIVRLAAEREVLVDNELVGMLKLANGREVWHNRALANVLGYGPGELSGQAERLLYADDESHDSVRLAAHAHLSAGHNYRTQVRMRRKDGRLIWIDLTGSQLPDGISLWFMSDVTAVMENEERARHQATHDALTELPNRQLLLERLEHLLERARQRGHALALCYIDLDGFKGVNDTHGHAAGDRLLREAARRIGDAVREDDVAARLGGDEFVVVLYGVRDELDVATALERLIARLSEPVGVREGAFATVGASIGVALYPRHAQSADQLLSRADDAMYGAKRTGKNRFVFWSEGELADCA